MEGKFPWTRLSSLIRDRADARRSLDLDYRDRNGWVAT